mmetsp:Transcript_34655/g.79831  ORF Transcript_34655/g.79831 Transcript_34655/m.79831 type:complete len:495 (-) Transcript_34655:46-1530(-)
MASLDLAHFESILKRLETVAEKLEGKTGPATAPGASSAGEDLPELVLAFDAYLDTKVAPAEGAAKDLGQEDVTDATGSLLQGLRLLRELLLASTRCQKPQDADWQKILGPVMELGGKAQKACEPRSDFFQHRKACAESLNVIMLVTSPSPPGHVQSVLETFDFHAMKVMQRKVDKETAWIKAVKQSLKDLKDWAAENCKLGVIWNVKGQAAMDYFSASPLGSGGAAGAAAAPAPKSGKGKGKGPAMPKGGAGMPEEVRAKLRESAPAAKAPAGAGMSAVFNAIGEFNTGSLKKVTADMKTKNQPKDGPQVVAAKPKAAPAAKSFSKRGPRGEPKKELQKDVNWMVENYDGERNLVMDDVSMSQLVCIINCRNTTVHIKNKVKSVCIDGCEKVNVICQDVISAVELVNSDRCQMQAVGKVVAIAIDKCDGVNVFLSKESIGAEITASKSSEMNVTIPDPDGQDDGDIIEMPIPEQFISKVVGKKLKTEVSHIYSS